METRNTKNILRRLSIAEGQIRGLRELIASGTYCIDVITQTSAVKQALSGVEDILLENHLTTCALRQIQKGQEKQAIEEIIKVYKLKRR
ncbi:metal-sensitive transcriptional regulator [Candidatus Uhrbacteria bacterium]|nr:metal-sensitive transcriptional regulator [Candidatus Uhrbacteria bacterium]